MLSLKTISSRIIILAALVTVLPLLLLYQRLSIDQPVLDSTLTAEDKADAAVDAHDFFFDVSALAISNNNKGIHTEQEQQHHHHQQQQQQMTMMKMTQFEGPFFLDWCAHSDNFGYLNYKSIEALLASYPRARIEVMIVAPEEANYYKFRDRLSKHWFMKYKKGGFDIEVAVQASKEEEEGQKGEARRWVVGGVGREGGHAKRRKDFPYWQQQMRACCSVKKIVDIRGQSVVPLHFSFFHRIFNLASAEGGVYCDFSFLFSRTQQQQQQQQEQQQQQHKQAEDGSTTTNSSATSSHSYFGKRVSQDGFLLFTYTDVRTNATRSVNYMQFRPSSPIPPCMLKKYLYDEQQQQQQQQQQGDSNGQASSSSYSDFYQCITQDTQSSVASSDEHRDAFCIQKAMQACFEEHNVENSFTQVVVEDLSSEAKALWNGETTNKKNSNSSSSSSSSSITSNSKRRAITAKKLPAIWLGPRAISNSWLDVHQDVEQERLQLLLEDTTRPAREAMAVHLAQKVKQSGSKDNHAACLAATTNNCSTYHLDASNASSRLFKRAQASRSCSPSFAIAGFMKSASTFVFEHLARHPQVLKALRGVAFKETGCYLPTPISGEKGGSMVVSANRMDCFPFVEPSQGFIFGDATVYYAARSEVAEAMKRDNPNMKVLFVVRNPIERLESHHRFSYKSFKQFGLHNINEMIDTVLNPPIGGNQGIVMLRRLATIAASHDAVLEAPKRAAAIEALMKQYRKGLRRGTSEYEKKFHRAANIFFHSIYFPAIYLWRDIMGKENILVVASETLRIPSFSSSSSSSSSTTSTSSSSSVLQEQFRRIFSFLKLCPWDVVPKEETHATKEIVPVEHRLNATSRLLLQNFFSSFNNLTTALLSSDFGY